MSRVWESDERGRYAKFSSYASVPYISSIRFSIRRMPLPDNFFHVTRFPNQRHSLSEKAETVTCICVAFTVQAFRMIPVGE